MPASLPKSPLVLSVLLLLLLISVVPSLASTAHGVQRSTNPLTYHNGPMLTQNVNLGILWYGQFGRVQKNALNSFISSLNVQGNTVSKWWKMVESVAYKTPYAKTPRIKVNVVNQVTDASYSSGKVLTVDFLPNLIQKATGGKSNTVAVVFTSRQVTVVGTCTGECSLHGVMGTLRLLHLLHFFSTAFMIVKM